MDRRPGDSQSTPGGRVSCIKDDTSIPSSSATITTTTTTTTSSRSTVLVVPFSSSSPPSRYESQKRRDWNTFSQYLEKQYDPPLSLSQCCAAHVVEFLGYMDRFGKTKIHTPVCRLFGLPNNPRPPAAAAQCPCPLRQAWGSLDALIGRLRAAFEENGGKREANPFGARAVRLYLREVRELQAKARGMSYKKQRKPKPHISKSKTTTSSIAPASPTSLS